MGAAMGCFNSKVAHELSHRAPDEKNPPKDNNSNRSSVHKNSLRLVATDNESLKTLTFKHVMKDPMGREYFMKFLKLEHAEENLLFFEEVEKIKNDGTDKLKDNATGLVDNYLTPGVETEVNISDNMKRQLINLATEDVMGRQLDFYKGLERAQNEVMMILAMGAFPRFLKSEHFHNYKVKVRELREKENEESVRAAEKAL